MNYPILELWYTALAHPIGISVTCSNTDRMKAKLYKARKDAGDERLAALMIHTSPRNPEGEVFITHRHVNFEPEDLKDG